MNIIIKINCDTITELQQHLVDLSKGIREKMFKEYEQDGTREFESGTLIEGNNCYGTHELIVVDEFIDISDSEMLDWMQGLMTDDDDYCEIFFAGLRNGTGKAGSFQIESNPNKFETTYGKDIRESIKNAMTQKQIL